MGMGLCDQILKTNMILIYQISCQLNRYPFFVKLKWATKKSIVCFFETICILKSWFNLLQILHASLKLRSEILFFSNDSSKKNISFLTSIFQPFLYILTFFTYVSPPF